MKKPKAKERSKSIETSCRDLASELMEDDSWDRRGYYVLSILWKAADEIARLKRELKKSK
jgi:hypothetical protein